MDSEIRFRISINRLYPGEKLRQGDKRWRDFNAAFRTEEHTPGTLLAEIQQGHAFCPALKGYRKAENFVSSQCLALDMDCGARQPEDLLADEFINQYASFFYSTLSYSPESPRWRVVFILPEPLTDSDIYRKAQTALLAHYGDSDQSIKDPARLLFGSNPHTTISHFLGNVLPMVEVLKLVTEYEDKRRQLDRTLSRRQPMQVESNWLTGDTRDARYVSRAVQEEIAWLESRIKGSGERHSGLLAVAARLESLRISEWLDLDAREVIDPYALALEAAQANGYLDEYGVEDARRAIAWGIAHAEPRPMPPDWGQHYRDGIAYGLPEIVDYHTARDLAGSEPGLTLTPLSKLLAEPPEQVSWVMENTLPMGGVAILAAKPKVGKSTLARNLALAVSRGEPFLGRPTRKGPVVCLCIEEKRSQVQKHFASMGATDEPIHVHVGTAPEKALENLERIIVQIKPVLVIIDPLLKFVRIRDINDYAEVTRALEPVLGLARVSGTHILLVHHTGKMEREGGDGILGSTALFGAVDTALVMRRKQAGRTLESIQRYGEDIPETVIGFNPETGATAAAGTVAEVETQKARTRIVEVIGEGAMTQAEIRESIEGQTRYTVAALQQLIQEKILSRSGTGKKGDPFRYSVSNENAGLLVPTIYGKPANQQNQNSPVTEGTVQWTSSGSVDGGHLEPGSPPDVLEVD